MIVKKLFIISFFLFFKRDFGQTFPDWFLICVVEAIRHLKINDNWDRDAAAQSTQYPDRPGEPECLYYLRTGMCGYGTNCRYHHPAHISIVRAFSLFSFSFFCIVRVCVIAIF